MKRYKSETTLYITDQNIGFFHRQNRKTTLEAHAQVELDKGIVEKGYVGDPNLLLEKLRRLFKKNQIQPNHVRIVLNSQNILTRVVDLPKTAVPGNDLGAYLDSNLGKTLHFPFARPKVSFHVIHENPESLQVLLVAADDKLLNDYLDIFERMNVKDVVFDIPSMALYNLLLTQNDEKFGNLMLVTLFSSYFTIKIFENDIPIFNVIEELEGHPDTWYEQVENFVDRIANYYRYNLHQGSRQIDNVMFVNFGPQTEDSRFEKAFSTPKEGIPHRVFHFVVSEGAEAVWPRSVLMAYAASAEKTATLARISSFDFRLDRPRKLAKYLVYLMAVAVAVFSGVSLIAIPLATSHETIAIQQNRNETLREELRVLQGELASLPSFTQKERNYSDAFDTLAAMEFSPTERLGDLFAHLNEEVVLVRYELDAEEGTITLILDGASAFAVHEYLLSVYEQHGLTSTPETSRWINGFPEQISLPSGWTEVTIRHA